MFNFENMFRCTTSLRRDHSTLSNFLTLLLRSKQRLRFFIIFIIIIITLTIISIIIIITVIIIIIIACCGKGNPNLWINLFISVCCTKERRSAKPALHQVQNPDDPKQDWSNAGSKKKLDSIENITRKITNGGFVDHAKDTKNVKKSLTTAKVFKSPKWHNLV